MYGKMTRKMQLCEPVVGCHLNQKVLIAEVWHDELGIQMVIKMYKAVKEVAITGHSNMIVIHEQCNSNTEGLWDKMKIAAVKNANSRP